MPHHNDDGESQGTSENSAPAAATTADTVQPSDEQLLTWAQGPDVGRAMIAFQTLVEPYGSHLRGYIQSIVHQAEDAEDLCQDVWIKAWDHICQLRDCRSFRCWLYRIATSVAFDHMRRSKTHGGPMLSLDALDTADVRFQMVTSTPPDPFQRIEDEEVIENALRELSDLAQACVVLAHLHGFKYKEIAIVLDLPSGTVASCISRGMAALSRVIPAQASRGVHRLHAETPSAPSDTTATIPEQSLLHVEKHDTRAPDSFAAFSALPTERSGYR